MKVSEVDPFSGMLAAPNALMMTGGATTVTLAFDVFPVPPFVEVACTLLFFTLAVVPCTFTETVQLAAGARLAPLKETEDAPATAVAVPLHVLLRPLGVATTIPAGRLSVNATPFSVSEVFVDVSVNVKLVTPFSGIVAAPNAFAIVGGLITVRSGLVAAVLPFPASVESIVTVLWKVPSVVPCTFTVIAQVPTAKAAFVKLIVPAPATAVTVPPPALHPFTTAGVVATTKFAGSVSVKLDWIVTVFPLVMLNVIVLGLFTAAVVGLKLFVIEGGCRMMMLAVTVA